MVMVLVPVAMGKTRVFAYASFIKTTTREFEANIGAGIRNSTPPPTSETAGFTWPTFIRELMFKYTSTVLVWPIGPVLKSILATAIPSNSVDGPTKHDPSVSF